MRAAGSISLAGGLLGLLLSAQMVTTHAYACESDADCRYRGCTDVSCACGSVSHDRCVDGFWTYSTCNNGVWDAKCFAGQCAPGVDPANSLSVVQTHTPVDACPDPPPPGVQLQVCGGCSFWLEEDGNRLSSTGECATTCTYLYLSHRGIEAVAQGTFSGMTGLRSLSLRGNQISGSVAHDTFADLSALTWLDLADNKLTGFQEGAFSSLQELRTLYLQGNHLKGTQWLAQSEGDTCGGVLLRNGFLELTDSGGHACTLSVFLSLLSPIPGSNRVKTDREPCVTCTPGKYLHSHNNQTGCALEGLSFNMYCHMYLA